MPSDRSPDVKFDIGHVLFLDIVGGSKLNIDEQSDPARDAESDCPQHMFDRDEPSAFKEGVDAECIYLPTSCGTVSRRFTLDIFALMRAND